MICSVDDDNSFISFVNWFISFVIIAVAESAGGSFISFGIIVVDETDGSFISFDTIEFSMEGGLVISKRSINCGCRSKYCLESNETGGLNFRF
jgi:hypothetical protein